MKTKLIHWLFREMKNSGLLKLSSYYDIRCCYICTLQQPSWMMQNAVFPRKLLGFWRWNTQCISWDRWKSHRNQRPARVILPTIFNTSVQLYLMCVLNIIGENGRAQHTTFIRSPSFQLPPPFHPLFLPAAAVQTVYYRPLTSSHRFLI